MAPQETFKLGQSVRIKDGIKDEELDVDVGGWQGRIVELNPKEKMMLIDLDSVTLRSLDMEYIDESEEEGLDWAQYYIGYDDVTLVAARDTAVDVETAVAEIAAQAGWAYLGEDGRAINAILADIDIEDDLAQMVAWRDHFAQTLTFPFKAVVDEAQQQRSPVRAGDRVQVMALEDVDDRYGVIVRVKQKFSTFSLPLCDLKALDEESSNFVPVYLYALWFANR